MKDLVGHILEKVFPGDAFEVEETMDGDLINIVIKAPKDKMGLIIGKGGSTIKSIRNLVRVKATLDKKLFNLTVEEV